ncbi:unnamed protein product [Rotaria socialis]|uniref:Uncharacterized protein n=1 Tax=Rotaria socialis TaxID=392032 RepID=A0A821KNU9_9BILA|nr:unnamed protein product [Rotaria socialis]
MKEENESLTEKLQIETTRNNEQEHQIQLKDKENQMLRQTINELETKHAPVSVRLCIQFDWVYNITEQHPIIINFALLYQNCLNKVILMEDTEKSKRRVALS